MKCRIDKIEKLSGSASVIYTVFIDDAEYSLFDTFIKDNNTLFKSELNDIVKRLISIGSITGAREQFFKLNEGNPGDGVCALYDDPEKKLRLYCIRYGTTAIILGGGGAKPKNIRKLQENEKLREENYLLRDLSEEITGRIKNMDIQWSFESNDLIGTLEFNTDEE